MSTNYYCLAQQPIYRQHSLNCKLAAATQTTERHQLLLLHLGGTQKTKIHQDICRESHSAQNWVYCGVSIPALSQAKLDCCKRNIGIPNHNQNWLIVNRILAFPSVYVRQKITVLRVNDWSFFFLAMAVPKWRLQQPHPFIAVLVKLCYAPQQEAHVCGTE